MQNISSDNFFTSENLNRMVDKRTDTEWLKQKLDDPDTLFIPLWRGKNLFDVKTDPKIVFLKKNEIDDFNNNPFEPALIGELNDKIYFTLSLPDDDAEIENRLSEYGIFSSIRKYGVLLPKNESSILGYANALDNWQKRNQFCGLCGNKTILTNAGHRLICSNEKCELQSFPRTDPVIITLIYKGEECLLVRQSNWQNSQYALVAGFVEPGESIESAVAREIFEETGILVDEIQYQSSQPWPFPTSIMLGFTARALTKKITLQIEELEDAKWMTRVEIIKNLKSGELKLPTKFSIAYKLFENWFNNDDFNLSVILSELN